MPKRLMIHPSVTMNALDTSEEGGGRSTVSGAATGDIS